MYRALRIGFTCGTTKRGKRRGKVQILQCTVYKNRVYKYVYMCEECAPPATRGRARGAAGGGGRGARERRHERWGDTTAPAPRGVTQSESQTLSLTGVQWCVGPGRGGSVRMCCDSHVDLDCPRQDDDERPTTTKTAQPPHGTGRAGWAIGPVPRPLSGWRRCGRARLTASSGECAAARDAAPPAA